MLKILRKELLPTLITTLFGLMTLFLFALTIIWVYPRSPVVGEPTITTTKETFQVGEPITTIAEVQTNVQTKADFDIRLVCEDVLIYSLLKLDGLQSTVMEQRATIPFTFGDVPEQVGEDLKSFNIESYTCVVESRGTYPVQIAPFITKDLHYVYRSNQFKVVR